MIITFSKGGGKAIEKRLRDSIFSFLEDHSTVASNRLVKNKLELNKNRFIPARYLEENRIEIYKKSPFRNLVSKSTFYKYTKKSNQFKKPHR